MRRSLPPLARAFYTIIGTTSPHRFPTPLLSKEPELVSVGHWLECITHMKDISRFSATMKPSHGWDPGSIPGSGSEVCMCEHAGVPFATEAGTGTFFCQKRRWTGRFDVLDVGWGGGCGGRGLKALCVWVHPALAAPLGPLCRHARLRRG